MLHGVKKSADNNNMHVTRHQHLQEGQCTDIFFSSWGKLFLGELKGLFHLPIADQFD